jgi:hypothetical protein
MHEWLSAPVVLVICGVVGALVANAAIGKAPASLMRTNVDGELVPAVLGFGILAGGALAVALFQIWEALFWRLNDCPAGQDCPFVVYIPPWDLAWVALIPLVGMFLAGFWDDMKGDERPRGFAGHIGALRGGAITGGLVKLLAGVIVGLVTVLGLYGWALPGWSEAFPALLIAASIALGANLLNLLDRAPGRALKVFLGLTFITLAVYPEWRFIVAGVLGAALAVFPYDLATRGMLGDAGANSLGAVAGLGLALRARGIEGGTGTVWLCVIALILLGLNLLSEKVSFSAVIERTPWLARLDQLGRK